MILIRGTEHFCGHGCTAALVRGAQRSLRVIIHVEVEEDRGFMQVLYHQDGTGLRECIPGEPCL